MKIAFLPAAGRLLCGVCDRLLTYLPHGRSRFEDMKDNDRLAAAFRDMPLQKPLLSMLPGCPAMFLFAFSYPAPADWRRAFSGPCALLMLIGTVMALTFCTAHHVLCGVPKRLYVKPGRTKEARQLITGFFKKTSATMIVCYLGFLILMLILMPTRTGSSAIGPGRSCSLGCRFLSDYRHRPGSFIAKAFIPL